MRIEPKEPPKDLPQASRWNVIFMKRTNRLAIGMFVGGIIYYIVTRLLLKSYP